MRSEPSLRKLYSTLAPWFHLLTSPEDYSEEAGVVLQVLGPSAPHPVRPLLELGSGGGNNASHLKRSLQMTLVDLSSDMLALSRRINPECEHIAGDMRSVRLHRQFDGVLVHDAVMYMTSVTDLKECIETAYVHCKPGGTALFMPDFVKETFVNCVHHGGHDDDSRSLRYFEWTFDPDPSDATYTVDFVYMLREPAIPLRIEHDLHLYGLFSCDVWTRLLGESGFAPTITEDPYGRQ